jgi:IS4 transposase
LELSAQKIIDIYSLRFQIEFNFRDVKQFFGLSDFKNIKKEQVKNAINLSLFMTLLSKILLLKYRKIFGLNNLYFKSKQEFYNYASKFRGISVPNNYKKSRTNGFIRRVYEKTKSIGRNRKKERK